MAIPTKTLAEFVSRALGHYRTLFPGFPVGLKKFLGRSARALSLVGWGFHKAAEDLDADIVPTSRSSGDVLAEWLDLTGLPDGAGGFGPLVPTVASGGVATLTGTFGTVYPSGLQAVAEDGTTVVELSGGVTLPGTSGVTSAPGDFVAVTAGTVGNLPIGTVLTWSSPPAGADPSVTLTSPLSGAVDSEDNSSMASRIKERLQTPPRGGSEEDYRIWAETVGAVKGVFVYPKRSGTGTVDVALTVGGSGQGRVAPAAVVSAVQDYFDVVVPVGAEFVTAMAPYAPNGTGHLIRVRVVPRSANAFDWVDSVGGPFTVDTYTPGSPATIKLNTLAPASLKAAIDAYIAGTGPQPRLQVLSTGSVINVSVGTSPTLTWTDGGGKTTIRLDSLPTDWVAPTAGDAVYAYGPVVATIAANILAIVDALGPSRVSGFADDLTVWDDILSISSLVAAAENATDSSGVKLIVEVIVNGAQIDGSPFFDVEGSDGVNGPELLYASHIAVTQ